MTRPKRRPVTSVWPANMPTPNPGAEIDSRRSGTLHHLRGKAPDPLTYPSHDDFDVSKTVWPVDPTQRVRKHLNDPPDNGSLSPAGTRSFDAETVIVGRQAGTPSLPEALIVRVAGTGVPAKPYEYLHDRYPDPRFVGPPKPIRRRKSR